MEGDNDTSGWRTSPFGPFRQPLRIEPFRLPQGMFVENGNSSLLTRSKPEPSRQAPGQRPSFTSDASAHVREPYLHGERTELQNYRMATWDRLNARQSMEQPQGAAMKIENQPRSRQAFNPGQGTSFASAPALLVRAPAPVRPQENSFGDDAPFGPQPYQQQLLQQQQPRGYPACPFSLERSMPAQFETATMRTKTLRANGFRGLWGQESGGCYGQHAPAESVSTCESTSSSKKMWDVENATISRQQQQPTETEWQHPRQPPFQAPEANGTAPKATEQQGQQSQATVAGTETEKIKPPGNRPASPSPQKEVQEAESKPSAALGSATPKRKVRLNVINQNGVRSVFNVPRNYPFEKLMQTYGQYKNVPYESIRFRIDGEPIFLTDTVESLGLQDDDSIDAFVRQTGGGPQVE